MKKSVKVLLLVLAVLLALTGVGLFAVTRLDARAKQEHAALSGAVEARMNWISGTRVALTENGAEIGSYTLEDLGLSQSAQAAATNGLSQIDLLPEAEFFGEDFKNYNMTCAEALETDKKYILDFITYRAKYGFG